MKKLLGAATIAAAAVTLAAAPIASADDNCQSVPWGFLGSQTRQICDGPVRPDGSWMRERIVGRAAYWANPSSYCSGGLYYSRCTYNPGGYVPEYHSDEETYVVTPDTVLPDEPGHLGFTPGAAAY